jgi:LuxR family transcriptional regulator, maltose regulon positive regulatory protein
VSSIPSRLLPRPFCRNISGYSFNASLTVLLYEIAMPAPLRGHASKYVVPRQPEDLVRRPRLVDFIHSNLHLKLIMVSAAAGYGKTSLLTDVAHNTDYPVAWLQLDEADGDCAALVADVAASMRQAFPAFESAVPVLAAQPNSRPGDLARALNRELEEKVADYFVLVLDDFHLVEASENVIRFFDELLRGLPEAAHLIIASRTLPPLYIASLAARRQVVGLSEEHLRFTRAEVQELLQQRNRLPLPDEEAERLAAQTDGWITGILLTTHLMWQGLLGSLMDARKSSEPLYEYLANEVLDQQPPELRQFVLESAVLPEMEAAVCDAVLGRSGSALLLRQAMERRLFISAVGDEFPTYQYHPLFRDFLISRLGTQGAERLQALRVRAAGWYAANGMPAAAVTYFCMAGAMDQAARVAEAHADAMYLSGRFETIRLWAEQLPAQAVNTPSLQLAMVKVKTSEGKLDEALGGLHAAEEGYARRADALGRVRVDLQRSRILYLRGQYLPALALAQAASTAAGRLNALLQESGALRYAGACLRALGRLPEAEEALERAQALLRNTQHRYDLAATLNDLALVLRTRGQTARAAHCQREVLGLWRELGAPEAMAVTLNNIAWDLHMLGQYEGALETYHEAQEWARRSGVARTEVMLLTGQAALLADLGDAPRAAALLRQAMTKGEPSGERLIMGAVYRELARLDRRAGNTLGALEWLRRAALAAGATGEMPAPLEGLRGIVLVDQGHLPEGRLVLAEACARLQEAGALVDLAQVLLFRAFAEFQAGELETAAHSLSDALSSAERVGYDRMLVMEVEQVAALLIACSARPDVGRAAAGLLSRAKNVRAIGASLQLGEPVVAAPRAAPAIAIRALGRSHVLKEGVEIPRSAWQTQRTRELFFFLVDRAPIERERVLTAFWPDKPMARATANLNQTLYQLRRAIGHELVSVEGQRFILQPDLTIDDDVRAFQTAARRALALPSGATQRVSVLSDALSLYTGDYLEDLPADWAQPRQHELRALHVQVLRAYAIELMALTRYVDARQALDEALRVEEYDDELHEQMLECLGRLGRRNAVVEHYVRYRDQLRSELGLEPSASITELYARLIQ